MEGKPRPPVTGPSAWLTTACLMTLSAATANAQTIPGATVPFVGCAADGQLGPVRAPRRSGPIPAVPASAAGRLAYYASKDLAVLAPRGWHCFGLYGPDGSILMVTPDAHAENDLLDPRAKIAGPAVVLSYDYGGTSGRLAVARVAARVFPVAGPFVRQVALQDGPAEHSAAAISRQRDTVRRLSATEVEFITPANREGIGTAGRLARSDQSVVGVAILAPGEFPDLMKLDVRLPPALRDLSRPIVTAVEGEMGAPVADRRS